MWTVLPVALLPWHFIQCCSHTDVCENETIMISEEDNNCLSPDLQYVTLGFLFSLVCEMLHMSWWLTFLNLLFSSSSYVNLFYFYLCYSIKCTCPCEHRMHTLETTKRNKIIQGTIWGTFNHSFWLRNPSTCFLIDESLVRVGYLLPNHWILWASSVQKKWKWKLP